MDQSLKLIALQARSEDAVYVTVAPSTIQQRMTYRSRLAKCQQHAVEDILEDS